MAIARIIIVCAANAYAGGEEDVDSAKRNRGKKFAKEGHYDKAMGKTWDGFGRFACPERLCGRP